MQIQRFEKQGASLQVQEPFGRVRLGRQTARLFDGALHGLDDGLRRSDGTPRGRDSGLHGIDGTPHGIEFGVAGHGPRFVAGRVTRWRRVARPPRPRPDPSRRIHAFE